jgi:hypothetical protein
MSRTSPDVETYLATLDHPLAPHVRALRDAILGLDVRISEHIKWKAPSFVVNGDDRVTFALRPGKGLDVILHRGVAVRADTADFRFEDDTGVVRWATRDRGIIAFPDAATVERQRDAVLGIIRRWIDA